MASLNELKSFFNETKRNFFLFELDDETFAANLIDEKVYDHLFGDYEDNGLAIWKKITKDMLHGDVSQVEREAFSATSHSLLYESENFNEYEDLTDEEKTKIIDEILDKGPENLTAKDKEILKKIAKK
jgi:hypothetical protein